MVTTKRNAKHRKNNNKRKHTRKAKHKKSSISGSNKRTISKRNMIDIWDDTRTSQKTLIKTQETIPKYCFLDHTKTNCKDICVSKMYHDNFKKAAIVTLLMINNNYLPSTLLLGISVRDAYTKLYKKHYSETKNTGKMIYGKYDIELVCLVTPDITESDKNDIAKVYDKVITVGYIEIPHKYICISNPAVQKIYAKTFTKLNILNMTQYDKVLYMDSDNIVTNPILFTLFDLKTPAGVFVGSVKPYENYTNYKKYMEMYPRLTHGKVINKAYIKKNSNKYIGFESSIMLVHPNVDDYSRMACLLGNYRKIKYKADTTLFNIMFDRKMTVMDIRFLGRWLSPKYNSEIAIVDMYGSMGKPWDIDKFDRLIEYVDIHYWYRAYLKAYKKKSSRLANIDNDKVHSLFKFLNARIR